MKLKLNDICILLSVFLWFSKRGDCSLSCIHSFLRVENVKHLVFVDRKSDYMPLFDTTDWTIITATDISLTLDRARHGTDIIIATSAADVVELDFDTVHLANGRIYVILINERHSIDTIRSIFSKFNENVQRNVIVMEQVTRGSSIIWRFYRLIDHKDCTKDNSQFVGMFAKCNENGIHANAMLSTNRSKFAGKMCPLTVAAAIFEPYTYYDEARGFYGGMDYFLVKTIAKHLHTDVKFIPADEKSIKYVPLKCREIE